MPHVLPPHEDRRLDVERHRRVLERRAVPLAHEEADESAGAGGVRRHVGQVCSPSVDTRAANTTSESAAADFTSSTVTSLRNSMSRGVGSSAAGASVTAGTLAGLADRAACDVRQAVRQDRPVADMSVRPARATDAEGAAQAQLAAWQTDRELPRLVLDGLDLDGLTAQWTEAAVRPPSPRHRVLVAVVGGDAGPGRRRGGHRARCRPRPRCARRRRPARARGAPRPPTSGPRLPPPPGCRRHDGRRRLHRRVRLGRGPRRRRADLPRRERLGARTARTGPSTSTGPAPSRSPRSACTRRSSTAGGICA